MRSSAIRAVLGMVVAVMLFTTSDAGAIIVNSLEGSHFAGIFQSSLNQNDTGFFDVSIDSVKNRSFACHLMIAGNPTPDDGIPCQGTLSAAGVFEVIAQQGVFQVHGMLGPTGLAEAKYRFGADEGTLLMMQQRKGEPPNPAVFGMFDGDFMSETTMMGGMLSLNMSRDSKRGDAQMDITETILDDMGNVSAIYRLSFDVLVNTPPPDLCKPDTSCMQPLVLVGLSNFGDPGGFIAIGTVDAGGAMGEFEFRPLGIGNNEIVDMGTFDIARIFGDVIG